MSQRLTISAGDWVLLFILSTFWGGSFFFAQVAVREIPPLTLALARVALAAAILVVYVRAAGIAMPAGGATWRSLAVMAFINNVIPFTLIFWSQTHITSGLASILNATVPMFTIVVAHFATEDDRLTTRRIVSLAAGFAGVIIVIGPDALRDLGVHVAAELASLTAALFYAISGVYGRRFQGEAPAAVSAGLLIMATLWLVPLAALVDRPWTLPVPSAEAILSTMALAVIATAAAYLIYFRVLARAGATNLGLVTFLIPVSAIVLGSAFLGEALEIRHFVGMGGIALGLAAIDGRPQRWLARALKAAKPGASPTK